MLSSSLTRLKYCVTLLELYSKRHVRKNAWYAIFIAEIHVIVIDIVFELVVIRKIYKRVRRKLTVFYSSEDAV